MVDCPLLRLIAKGYQHVSVFWISTILYKLAERYLPVYRSDICHTFVMFEPPPDLLLVQCSFYFPIQIGVGSPFIFCG